MAAPLLRKINYRYRGPKESRKVNQMIDDILCDTEILYSLLAELQASVESLSSIIVMGEYVDVRIADTL